MKLPPCGGDIVAVRYRERGRFVGRAPTGKMFELIAMEWIVVNVGRIHRRRGVRDAAQSRQIVLPLN